MIPTVTLGEPSLPAAHAVGAPICRRCHWYSKQVSFGNPFVSAATS